MPKINTPAFTQSVRHISTTFTSSDTTNFKSIASGGLNDSRITHITITSTDNTSNIAFFSFNNSTNTTICHCIIPNGSGTNGSTNSVNVLSSNSFIHKKLDNNSNPYFELAHTWSLHMRLANTITAGQTITVLVTLEDY